MKNKNYKKFVIGLLFSCSQIFINNSYAQFNNVYLNSNQHLNIENNKNLKTIKAVPSAIEFANAVELKDYKQIKEWLDKKIIFVNYDGSRIGKGLHIAVWNDDLEMINLFLNYGANINQKNIFNETPLAIAAFRGNKKLVDYLISKGANVNDAANSWSPLHYAAFNGYDELVNILIDKYHANIDAISPNGTTPLMAAVYENKTDTARLLLQKGANKNIANDRGDTAFTWAMRRDNIRLAKDLTTDAKFQAAMLKPKNSWKPLPRSLIPSQQLYNLLSLKQSLEQKGVKGNKLAKVNEEIDAEKHRLIDQLFNRTASNEQNKMQLHIISSRKTKQETINLEKK